MCGGVDEASIAAGLGGCGLLVVIELTRGVEGPRYPLTGVVRKIFLAVRWWIE
jgi:hypothetical protein